MILKALYDYYNRSGDLAPAGTEYKEIAFVIVIDEDGNFIKLEDRRIDKNQSQRFLVAKGTRSGTTPKPYKFWDNGEYVLAYTKASSMIKDESLDNEEKLKLQTAINKSIAKNKAFIDQCRSISKIHTEEKEFLAVCLFYEKDGISKVHEDELWDDFEAKPSVNLSFRISRSNKIVAENEKLYRDTTEEANGMPMVCLVTGKKGEVVASSTPTPIAGGQATARLVAFQVNSGYDSYGKSKGANAPVSKEAEAAYTTALNKLLSKDSRNKFLIGNRTMSFWASSKSEASEQAEECFFNFFNISTQDDPNKGIENVRKVFNSIFSGSLQSDMDDKFYFLGLAPNSARIAVVYWNEMPLKDFAGKILRHFNDMEIIGYSDSRTYFGLYQILKSITLKGKVSDIQPNLPDTIIKSIIQGTPYPYTLLLACINRIRAEQSETSSVTQGRAAIIKAYLNRLNDNKTKIQFMLNKDYTNQGYLCGRLFSTLEKMQSDSNNGNSNIRSRYMNAASATPAAVFPTLLNLSVHHSDKLNLGQQIFYENLKSEIIEKLPENGFPTHLDLQDQGRFMVGYYHQRQSFFTKKEDKNENIESKQL